MKSVVPYFKREPIVLNYYGPARTIIALSTFITLISNDAELLFNSDGLDVQFAKFSLFLLLDVTIAKLIACLLLLIVASGWLPRLTGLLHWYVTFSFASSCDLITGGDHIAIIITFLMVPISLCDSRWWVWSPTSTINSSMTIVSNAFHFGIMAQASLIYFHAFSAKLPIDEWANGTAVYYWLNHSLFGATDPWLYFINPILKNSIGVVVFTWGPLIIEILLFAALFMSKRFSNLMFILGVGFHGLIALFHGLVTFGMVMTALLYLYLVPPMFRLLPYDNSLRLLWKKH